MAPLRKRFSQCHSDITALTPNEVDTEIRTGFVTVGDWAAVVLAVSGVMLIAGHQGPS